MTSKLVWNKQSHEYQQRQREEIIVEGWNLYLCVSLRKGHAIFSVRFQFYPMSPRGLEGWNLYNKTHWFNKNIMNPSKVRVR